VKKAVWTVLVLGALVGGCRDGAEGPPRGADARAGSDTSRAAPSPSANGEGPGAPIAGEDPYAAVEVVREYFRAIAAGELDRAYGFWEDGGRESGRSLEEFRRGFAETDSVVARVGGPGGIEGAAGSRYVSVPVVLRARTHGGRNQCFTGPITLRRAAVPGATPEQRRWRLYSADLALSDLAACAADHEEREAVVALVQSFGGRLADVPLTAPPDRLRRLIRETYGPLVTPSLLETWLAEPSAAPGREVSSPWPDRIEVGEARRLARDRWRVAAEVVLMTSVEVARGGDSGREPVDIEVSRAAGGWRISRWSD
jgi:hypothetical protein